MVKERTQPPKGQPPPPPPPKRIIKNDREIKMAETNVELRAPKQIPLLQIGVATCGVSLHMQQDYEGSYQMWRFMWTACAFGWRVGGILYPRGDLVGRKK